MLRIAGEAKQCAEQLSILLQSVQFGVDYDAEPFAQPADAIEAVAQTRLMLALDLLVIGHDDRFFAGEVVVSRPGCRARRGGNVPHRGIFKASLPEKLQGRIEDV